MSDEIDIEGIRKRNEQSYLLCRMGNELLHDGARCPHTKADIDALLAEVERKDSVRTCFECDEQHKTHPTREGAIDWRGHTCRCIRCLAAEVERLRSIHEMFPAGQPVHGFYRYSVEYLNEICEEEGLRWRFQASMVTSEPLSRERIVAAARLGEGIPIDDERQTR